MNSALRFVATFGMVALVVQLGLLNTEAAGTGEVRLMSPDESAAIWGAGEDCDDKNELAGTNGCTGTNCTPVENAKRVGSGDKKLDTWTCFYNANPQLQCGTWKVSVSCD